MSKTIILVIGLLIVLFVARNAYADTVAATVTAEITSTSEMSLDTYSFDFGLVTATKDLYRFRSPAATGVNITYFPAGPFEIRVYTNNGVGADYADSRGFIRNGKASTANRLYLKVWCPNFSSNPYISFANGPLLGNPTSMTQYLWSGKDLDGNGSIDVTPLESGTFSEADLGVDINGDGNTTGTFTASPSNKIGEAPSFSYVREWDKMLMGDNFTEALTRCVLVFDTLARGEVASDTLVRGIGSQFPLVLALETAGCAPGEYSSANNGTFPVKAGETCANGVIVEMVVY